MSNKQGLLGCSANTALFLLVFTYSVYLCSIDLPIVSDFLGIKTRNLVRRFGYG